ncbi:hypothetical protein AVEN_41490-1 [Araneus ventricosus]|uniref:Uncharacterized protein n=1 Tax=Araneus ventricosus TaxID=182803 RepID=A0A4Y2NQU2_ARAVE|nr:hypothetical protein AVEN_34119-1 [Araneus ventricosus]GBN42824.1 hypothetical protein AVEN_41490-1 [Araneus ventricosus]
MLGPWIHEVVSIPVHAHPPDTIGNDTRQTKKLVSSHQQFNGGVGGPRWRLSKLLLDAYRKKIINHKYRNQSRKSIPDRSLEVFPVNPTNCCEMRFRMISTILEFEEKNE